MASLVDLAEGVTVGVTSPADLVGGVTVGVASLTYAGVASLADPAGSVAGGETFLIVPVGIVTDGGGGGGVVFGVSRLSMVFVVITTNRTVLITMNSVIVTFPRRSHF